MGYTPPSCDGLRPAGSDRIYVALIPRFLITKANADVKNLVKDATTDGKKCRDVPWNVSTRVMDNADLNSVDVYSTKNKIIPTP
ncbi:hypothetical protein [Cylindrospermum stagnale]|uniref:hypothetical protein n=1 Tax=Cylindrospermum stagnale TaxID=142864 RepID=UPI0002D876A4|nr:hypothetical protein [Cylindrospermum stagnale]